MDRSHFDRPPGTTAVLLIAGLLFFAAWLKDNYREHTPVARQHNHYASN